MIYTIYLPWTTIYIIVIFVLVDDNPDNMILKKVMEHDKNISH